MRSKSYVGSSHGCIFQNYPRIRAQQEWNPVGTEDVDQLVIRHEKFQCNEYTRTYKKVQVGITKDKEQEVEQAWERSDTGKWRMKWTLGIEAGA